jgi:ribosome-associated heat shock protein Hsp15
MIGHHAAMETARVDRWLWAVRLFKTRSAATEACRAGHVRLNSARVKASAPVRVGDTVETRVGGRDRVVEVTRVIEVRVGAPEAAQCLVDHSPPPADAQAGPPPARRDRGAGRPTKKERRQLDRTVGAARAAERSGGRRGRRSGGAG